MNIINKLTLQHMRLNKKRTFVTTMGIILAVALMTAVPTVTYSIMDFAGRVAMEEEGYYHVEFKNYLYGDNQLILDELDINNYVITRNIGDYIYSSDMDGDIDIEPYTPNGLDEEITSVRVMSVPEEFYEMLSIKLVKGNYPTNDKEIIISDKMRDEGIRVGDKILFGNTEYTVSGLADHDFKVTHSQDIPTYIVCTKLDTGLLQESNIVDGYFFVNKPGEYIRDVSEMLVTELEKSNIPKKQLVGEDETWYCEGVGVLYNYDVLTFHGLSEGYNAYIDVCKLIMGILAVIIMIAGESGIANGFAISLSERNQYLGMLASIGATKKQKRGSVYFEGFIEGIISIPIGLLIGIGGTALLLNFVEPVVKRLVATNMDFYAVINYEVIIWAVAFSVLTICLSVHVPAQRASRISPIEAIRQNKDVKLSKKSVKTMGITKKIFGFEGDLALKNIKRNSKRYGVTVYSICISFILFFTIYSLIYYTKEEAVEMMSDKNYDMKLEMAEDNSGNIEGKFSEITDKLMATDLLEEYSRYSIIHMNASLLDDFFSWDKVLITEDKYFSEEYLEYINEPLGIEKNDFIYPVVMNESDLKKYLEAVDIDYEDFVSDKRNVILFDDFRDEIKIGSSEYIFKGDVYSDELSDIDYQLSKMKREQYQAEDGTIESQLKEIDKINMDFHVYSSEENLLGMDVDSVYMLITPQRAEELCEVGMNMFGGVTYGRKFALNTEEHREIEKIIRDELDKMEMSDENYYFENNTEEIEMQKDVIYLASVFAYGFIIFISLICVTSIFNTISTSFALRRREFAMLKSVGMTDKAFRKMIIYESWFYGMKALFFGIPISTVFVLSFKYIFEELIISDLGIPWSGYIIAIAGVFLVIGTTMLYSLGKIRKENIIDGLKNENV